MVGRAALCLALAGCRLLFDVDADPNDGVVEFEACGVQTYDPLRYLYKQSSGGIAWIDARSTCKAFAMDLAVFDTLTELQDVQIEGLPPYWLGVMGGNSLDNCPPVTDFADMQPEDPTGCLLVANQNFEMAQIGCGRGNAPSGQFINMLCETERLSEACTAIPHGPYEAHLDSLSFEEAGSECELVEINSPDELAKIETAAAAMGLDEFWLGSRWTGSAWEAPRLNCPNVFKWAPTEPDQTSGQVECAVHNLQVGTITRPCDVPTPYLCEH